jgi:hypothetical protein
MRRCIKIHKSPKRLHKVPKVWENNLNYSSNRRLKKRKRQQLSKLRKKFRRNLP